MSSEHVLHQGSQPLPRKISSKSQRGLHPGGPCPQPAPQPSRRGGRECADNPVHGTLRPRSRRNRPPPAGRSPISGIAMITHLVTSRVEKGEKDTRRNGSAAATTRRWVGISGGRLFKGGAVPRRKPFPASPLVRGGLLYSLHDMLSVYRHPRASRPCQYTVRCRQRLTPDPASGSARQVGNGRGHKLAPPHEGPRN